MIPTSPKPEAPALSSTKSPRPFGRWVALFAAASALIVAAACGSDGDDAGENPTPEGGAPGTSNPEGGSSSSGGFDAGAGEAKAPIVCTPPAGFDDCTGKCGPLRDPCTGVIAKQCGGCQVDPDGGGPQVCDLEKNNCIKPRITCEDLGAECGRLRNSCGVYIDCPTGDPNIECPAGDADGGLAGQECDPDTKKCRTATSVTCADLGYECGQAWLGVGPKTNLTNCGDCSGHADRPRCNSGLIPEYHVCEPACTPATTPDEKLAFCNAAKTSRGIQCGIISDGCGNAIDCSDVSDTFVCKDGKSCGVRGIANRCDLFETPSECIAAGKNCGTIKSVCSGLDVSCGTCTGTDICNTNGVCGPPCVPKKCADLGTPECLPPGTPVPDGCGGNVSDCPVCPGGPAACQAVPVADGGAPSVGGKCCVPTYSCINRPTGVATNACGSTHRFDNGCGVMIQCDDCGAGNVCGSDGTCCGPNACPAPGAVNDTCGAFDRGCGLSCTRTCANDGQGNTNPCTAGKCCNPEPDNAAEWRTANAGRCAFNIANGCGGVVDAPCLNGASCIDVAVGPGVTITDPAGTTASAIGYCCSNPNSNCNTTNTCTTVANACVTGATVNCGAGQCPDGADNTNDEVCFATGSGPLMCCDPDTCPGARPEGSACGNNAFDRGCGLSCNPGCANDSGGKANVCNAGTCCNPEPDDANEWKAANPGDCAFNVPNGCGGLVDAPCASGQICQSGGTQVSDVGSTFASGSCCTSADSCGGAAKAVGAACVVDNMCLNGSQTVQCPCVGGAVCFANNCCAPAACPAGSGIGGPCGTFDRGCGQSCTRACSAGSCYQGSCCQPSACPGAAPIGGACGSVSRGCGQSCAVACDTSGNKNNNTCQGGTCTCVPSKCPPGFTGSMQNGCGQIMACTGS